MKRLILLSKSKCSHRGQKQTENKSEVLIKLHKFDNLKPQLKEY